MAVITGHVDRHRRLIVPVGIQPKQASAQGVQPVLEAVGSSVSALRGLIDTGAQKTCITQTTARALGLRPRGRARVGGVGGLNLHNRYHFVLGVPYGDEGGRGYFQFDEVQGVDFHDTSDFEVLIGMDIIQQGDLTIRRDGSFSWQLS